MRRAMLLVVGLLALATALSAAASDRATGSSGLPGQDVEAFAVETAGDVKPAAVCKHGGYVDLFALDGLGTSSEPSQTFAKQAECMGWIRDGGSVGTLRPELTPDTGTMHFWLTLSGAAPVGTVAACSDLPLLVSYTVSGAGPIGSGCLDPPVYGSPFQVLYGPCTVGGTSTVSVLLAKAGGGVVGRTVSEACS